MTSAAFRRALHATGYLDSEDQPAPGLFTADAPEAARLRAVMKDARVGLKADAVFTAQNTPTGIFKDAGDSIPSEADIGRWHEAAWNIGLAPLLWIVTPTEVRLYDCYASPWRRTDLDVAARPLERFSLNVDEQLRALDAMCGRLATETGAFWSSAVGRRIDRQYRVDRELLAEINALEELLTALPPVQSKARHNGPSEIAAARNLAQRLIGRCIFTWYLIDRGIAQPFFPRTLRRGLSAMMATPESAFHLFGWLRKTFNGDLFPMDDPGAERMRLGPAHLSLVRDFIEGRSLVPENNGQGRLFRFRFDAIPVDLISAIYQQFARSSAQEKARLQGLHYTPIELVHLTLDPVFEDLPATARVIDPTCGSGAFLVEAFRRLVWKRCGSGRVSRAVVREVLYNQLYGIDLNPSALGIAAFSLYLAALEFDEEPITDIADLKFDRLIGATLFEADTVGEDLLVNLSFNRPFDAVVGNPPWTFVKRKKAKSRGKKGVQSPRPRRSPDWAFLDVAATLAGEKGRIGMVMKASPFFSKDKHAVEARAELLSQVKPAALINLSALRKEHLFPDAIGPALLFFARCSLMPASDQLLVGSMPWTPDFVRNGIFHVGPSELRTVPLRRVLKTPAMLKAATFGTVRDSWLIERLEREFPTFADVLNAIGIQSQEGRGQGYQVEGNPNIPPRRFYRLKTLTPETYRPFRINVSSLPLFAEPTLHRIRNESIYRGPLLLCPKASFSSGVDPSFDRLCALDAAVAELYEFDQYELVLTRESIERARMLISESRARRRRFVKPPSREPLRAYAETVASVVDGYLRTRGMRHLEAVVYSRPLVSTSWADGSGGLTAVQFRMKTGRPAREPTIKLGEDAELTLLADQLKGRIKSDLPPYLNERRNLRLYLRDSLYVVKPSEVRYWTRTAGLNDADVILADHWLKASHAAHA